MNLDGGKLKANDGLDWLDSSNFVQVKHEMDHYEEDLSGELDEDGEQYEDNAFWFSDVDNHEWWWGYVVAAACKS